MATARSLKQHLRNANKGTSRGAIQIEQSVKKFGFGRSIVTDKNDMIVAGNHLNDFAAEKDVKVITVETTGDTLVVVKRTDFDLSDPKDKRAVEYAVADNQTAKAGLEWDGDVLAQEIEDGADFSDFFTEDELAEAISGEKKKGKGEDGTFKIKFTEDGLVRFKQMLALVKTKYFIDDDGEALLEALEKGDVHHMNDWPLDPISIDDARRKIYLHEDPEPADSPKLPDGWMTIEELYARVRAQHRISRAGFRGLVRRHVRKGILRIYTDLAGKKFAILLQPGFDKILAAEAK